MGVKEVSAGYSSQQSEGVPKGYKQTEVGVIPEDWDCVSVRELASRARNALVGGPFGSDLVSNDYVDNGVPVVRGQNMGKMYVGGEFVFVSHSKGKALEANLARPKDLIFTQRGSLGQVSMIPDLVFDHYLVSQSQMKLTVDKDRAKPSFVYYTFCGPRHQQIIRESTIQTGVPHINLGILGAIAVQLPSLREQDAIAEALGDADALIESLERLLTKKRQLKQGAMQELLTGKKRLPGFSGEWPQLRLGDLGDFLKGAGVTREESLSGEIACVRYGEIYTKHHNMISEIFSWISIEVAAKATRVHKGDILFAGSGETKEEIGKCVAFLNDRDAYAGGDIVILRPRGIDSTFLGYALNSIEVNLQKASRGQGDAVVHISAQSLSRITLSLPPKDEQTAIAEIFRDFDSDLAALERKIAKAHAAKQGMMQELLTGQIRLVNT